MRAVGIQVHNEEGEQESIDSFLDEHQDHDPVDGPLENGKEAEQLLPEAEHRQKELQQVLSETICQAAQEPEAANEQQEEQQVPSNVVLQQVQTPAIVPEDVPMVCPIPNAEAQGTCKWHNLVEVRTRSFGAETIQS